MHNKRSESSKSGHENDIAQSTKIVDCKDCDE